MAKTSERVGVLGDDTTGMLGSALSGSAPARSLS
jgi:hypothetical protein